MRLEASNVDVLSVSPLLPNGIGVLCGHLYTKSEAQVSFDLTFLGYENKQILFWGLLAMTPTPQQPSLAELLSKFVVRQAADRACGITVPPVNDVQPYEAAFAPLVEPRSAWQEATLALRLLGGEGPEWKFAPPPDWAALVAAPEGSAAVAFAAGSFPQLVKDLPALTRSRDRASLRPMPRAEFPATNLCRWVDQALQNQVFPQALSGIGVLRLAQHMERATSNLNSLRLHISTRWQTAFANEEAALLWDSGRPEEALAMWLSLPDSAPVCFNRGMALLFQDRPHDAKPQLQKAVELSPESSSWHHLGKLYLTLCDM